MLKKLFSFLKTLFTSDAFKDEVRGLLSDVPGRLAEEAAKLVKGNQLVLAARGLTNIDIQTFNDMRDFMDNMAERLARAEQDIMELRAQFPEQAKEFDDRLYRKGDSL